MRRYALAERAPFFAAVCSGSSVQAAAWAFGVRSHSGISHDRKSPSMRKSAFASGKRILARNCHHHCPPGDICT